MTRRAVILTQSGDTGPYDAAIRARGSDPLLQPILSIIHSDAPLPDLTRFNALVFTSVHAVDVFAGQSARRDLRVYTVGDTTAARARAAGFADVHSASGDARDLEKLIADVNKNHLLYLCGADIARSFAGVTAHIAYAAHPVESLDPSCRARIAQGGVESILFLSPRGGENFVRLVRAEGLETAVSGIKALCISPAVLESVSILPWAKTAVAARPDRDAMLALLGD